MNSAQKVIKYVAMGFAVLLIVGIMSGILTAVSSLSGVRFYDSKTSYVSFVKTFEDVRNLDIKNYSGRMNIQVGDQDTVMVEAKNVPDTMTAELDDKHTLVFRDKNRFVFNINFLNWNWSNDDDIETVVTITLPADFIADTISLNTGSGSVKVYRLASKSMDINTGSGKVIVDNLSAEHVDIITSSGAVEINDSTLCDGTIKSGSGAVRITESILDSVDIKTGSGAFHFSGELKGKTEIDGGSGNINLDISGVMEDYYIKCKAGSGGAWINGSREDDFKLGDKSSDAKVDIDGGSGRVTVNMNNEESR